jgi:hypothetical protein
MAQQNIVIGTQDAKAGDTLFDAFGKVEANTTELYSDVETIGGKVDVVSGVTPSAPAGSTFVSDGAGGGEFIRINGFGQFRDSRTTVGTPTQNIATGVRTKWICDAGTTNLEKSPSDLVDPLWDTVNNKIDPISAFDVYNLRIGFKVENYAGTAPYINFELDIGGGLGTIVEDSRPLVKGGGQQFVLLDFEVYSGSTFLANGGEIYLTYNGTGTCDIYDTQILIRRVMKNYV